MPAPERVAIAQAAWYVPTGLSAFASRRAFEAITGPKRDWWLVQMVALLAVAAGGALGAAGARGRVTPEIAGLGVGCGAAFTAIDLVYVARRRIRPTYLLDAAVELALLAAWARAIAEWARS